MLHGRSEGYVFLSRIGASALMVDAHGEIVAVERSPVCFPSNADQQAALRDLRSIGVVGKADLTYPAT